MSNRVEIVKVDFVEFRVKRSVGKWRKMSNGREKMRMVSKCGEVWRMVSYSMLYTLEKMVYIKQKKVEKKGIWKKCSEKVE